MTKPEMIKKIAEDNKLSTRQADDVLENFVQMFRTTLNAFGEIRINGIGTWRIKETAPRAGVNPHNGEKISIPAGKRVMFKATKGLI